MRNAGWTKHDENGCDPHLGFGWTKSPSGATQTEPLVVYTTAGGQSAGVGTIIKGYGQFPGPLPYPQQKWASSAPLVEPKNDPDTAHVDVAFRSGSIVCSGETSGDKIGDVVIVNPAGPDSKTIPLTEAQSEQEGWRRGSCFDGMGWHRILDTSKADGTLGMAENIFPVVAMYYEGEINAIFFASILNELSVPVVASNGWDPKLQSYSDMCKNTCDDDCDFGTTPGHGWSSMHIYWRDHKSVVCPKSLQCHFTVPFRGACCEATTIQV